MDAVEGKAVCGVVVASCRCCLDPGHEPPHRCDPACGGAWTGDDNSFEVVSLPGIGGATGQ